MTKRVKKDRLSKWDADGDNGFNDYQDDDISERSSMISIEGHARKPDTTVNPEGFQQGHQDPYYTGEGPHTLRYFYNELPEGGVPAAVQVKESKKEEKKRLKQEREARRGQGQLVQGPDAQQPEVSDNYYPYWYYYKAKNPDWIMRQQQYADASVLPAIDPTKRIEPIDPSQLPADPKLTAAQRKARKYLYSARDSPDIRYNEQKRRYEMMGKGGAASSLTTDENNDKQRTGSRQYVPLKDGDNTQSLSRNGRYSRGKLQTEYDWAEHYSQYMRNKSSLGSNDPPGYKPRIRSRRQRNRNGDNPFDDIYGSNNTADGNGGNNNLPNGNRNYNRRYRSMSQNQQYHNNNNNSNGSYSQQQHQNNSQSQTNPNHHRSAPHSDPNKQQHHTHSHQHDTTSHHNISSKDLTGSQFKVVDAAFKNTNTRSRYQNTQNSSSFAPPSIYNQSSYLPSITRDYVGGPHPMNYYGTQALTNDYKTLSYAPAMYKSNAQTRFYDRYLNNVIDKRLFT